MPELPEVEIHCRRLNDACQGRRLLALETPDTRRFEGRPESILGSTILGWRRRAKYLIAEFSSGWSLISHLGMTGQWLVNGGDERPHRRVVLSFEGQMEIALFDPRRFGWTWIVPTAEVPLHPRLKDLSLEPDDPRMTPEHLADALGRSRSTLHSRLLAQHGVVGLGNIAVSELCWRAKVHPLMRCNVLGMEAWERIHEAIGEHIAYVLSVEDPDEIVYLGYSGADNPFLCYGRADEPCARCGDALEREVSGGRSVTFCPSCQPRDEPDAAR
jgi:formamidopyrimidine-DNA glycosylase